MKTVLLERTVLSRAPLLLSPLALPFWALALSGLLSTRVLASDCNSNGIDDAQEIASGTSPDCNSNGVPDECDMRLVFGAEAARTLPLAERANRAIAADVDGDENVDLLVGSSQIYSGHGDGSFSRRPAIDLDPPEGASWSTWRPLLAATDADRNGSTDLLVLGEDSDGGRRSLVLVMNDSLPVGPDCEENRQLPGDCDQTGDLEIGDAIAILRVLFLEESETFPCGDGTPADSGNVRLLDWQGDGAIDVADAVGSLSFLFLGGPAHVLSDPSSPDECVPIAGCPALPACFKG